MKWSTMNENVFIVACRVVLRGHEFVVAIIDDRSYRTVLEVLRRLDERERPSMLAFKTRNQSIVWNALLAVVRAFLNPVHESLNSRSLVVNSRRSKCLRSEERRVGKESRR